MKRFVLAAATVCFAACTTVETAPASSTSTTVLPTLPPTVTKCSWELFPPDFTQIEPDPIVPGKGFKLTGSGGYLRDSCGGFDESARIFDVYLDGQSLGQIMCYVNRCEGNLILPPDTQAGMVCLSSQPGTCDLEILVADR